MQCVCIMEASLDEFKVGFECLIKHLKAIDKKQPQQLIGTEIQILFVSVQSTYPNDEFVFEYIPSIGTPLMSVCPSYKPFFPTLSLPCQVDTSLVHFVCSVIARILAFTNSCLNPFALYLLSETFQKQFNQQLSCCCRVILKCSLQSPTHLNTHVTSVRSTHHSMASLSIINGRRIYQEDCV